MTPEEALRDIQEQLHDLPDRLAHAIEGRNTSTPQYQQASPTKPTTPKEPQEERLRPKPKTTVDAWENLGRAAAQLSPVFSFLGTIANKNRDVRSFKEAYKDVFPGKPKPKEPDKTATPIIPPGIPNLVPKPATPKTQPTPLPVVNKPKSAPTPKPVRPAPKQPKPPPPVPVAKEAKEPPPIIPPSLKLKEELSSKVIPTTPKPTPYPDVVSRPAKTTVREPSKPTVVSPATAPAKPESVFGGPPDIETDLSENLDSLGSKLDELIGVIQEASNTMQSVANTLRSQGGSQDGGDLVYRAPKRGTMQNSPSSLELTGSLFD